MHEIQFYTLLIHHTYYTVHNDYSTSTCIPYILYYHYYYHYSTCTVSSYIRTQIEPIKDCMDESQQELPTIK